MRKRLRALAAAFLVMMLAAPASAFAYFDRGAVGVELGTGAVVVQAGGTVDVSVAFTPASDAQTTGCGMPRCPQNCSAECQDENGQCRCGGTDYATYYPDAVATTSDAGVATASYSAGRVRVTGVGAGTATVTVTGSLRQFENGTATLSVTVEGQASQGSAGAAAVETPGEAYAYSDDGMADVSETIMGRAIRMVRVDENLEQSEVDAAVAAAAGVDGDLTFWQGDTYFQPAWSVTLAGAQWTEAGDFWPGLTVGYDASGTLTQPLAGLDGFVTVEFDRDQSWSAPVLVYVKTRGNVADGADCRLFSWDEENKQLVAEGADVVVQDGYASFSVTEGKTYVISSANLAADAATIITRTTASCCATDAASTGLFGMSAGSVAALAVAIAAIVAAAVVVTVFVMKKKAGHENE